MSQYKDWSNLRIVFIPLILILYNFGYQFEINNQSTLEILSKVSWIILTILTIVITIIKANEKSEIKRKIGIVRGRLQNNQKDSMLQKIGRREYNTFQSRTTGGLDLERIYLSNIDGYQFEVFVEKLLQKLGYKTQRTAYTNDEGRDIIAERYGVSYVIECKHQKSSIGRPIIQKIHSATITYSDNAIGMVITSSNFSPAAVKYSKQINVELIDGDELKRMGNKAGFVILDSYREENPTNLPYICELPELRTSYGYVYEHALSDLVSYPVAAANYFKDKTPKKSIYYKKVIMVKIKYDVIFKTSTYIMDKIYKTEYKFFNEQFKELYVKDYFPESRLRIYNTNANHPAMLDYIRAPNFTYLKGNVSNSIKRKNYNYNYRGKNGQFYNKSFNMKDKDFSILDIKFILVPTQNIQYEISNETFWATIEYFDGIFVKGDNKKPKFICNACDKIFFNTSMIPCDFCLTILCKKCVKYVNHNIFGRKNYCEGHYLDSLNPSLEK